MGIFPTAWAASVWKKMPRFLHSAPKKDAMNKSTFGLEVWNHLPISFIGWITPISLFTVIIETKEVSGVIALSNVWKANRFTVKSLLVRKNSYLQIDQSALVDWQVRHLEPFAFQITTRVQDTLMFLKWQKPLGSAIAEEKLSYRLSSDNVLLPLSIEMRNTFHSRIVRFGGSTGEENFAWICADQIGNVLKKEYSNIYALSIKLAHTLRAFSTAASLSHP